MFRLIMGAFIALPVLAIATGMYNSDKPSGCCGKTTLTATECPSGQCEEGCGCCTEADCACDGCECTTCESSERAAGCCEAGNCEAGCCPASQDSPASEEVTATDGQTLTSASCNCGKCEEGCGCCVSEECTCANCECALCAA